jgi:hypothetical protein
MKIVLALVALSSALALAAEPLVPLEDGMENAVSFHGAFGSPPTEARALGDGTVALTRRATDKDAGIDWFPAGKNVPVTTPVLTILFAEKPASGKLVASVLFFDKQGAFIDGSETTVISGKPVTSTIDVTSLGGFGRVADTVASYRLRLRPLDPAVPVVLDSITAMPAEKTK